MQPKSCGVYFGACKYLEHSRIKTFIDNDYTSSKSNIKRQQTKANDESVTKWNTYILRIFDLGTRVDKSSHDSSHWSLDLDSESNLISEIVESVECLLYLLCLSAFSAQFDFIYSSRRARLYYIWCNGNLTVHSALHWQRGTRAFSLPLRCVGCIHRVWEQRLRTTLISGLALITSR